HGTTEYAWQGGKANIDDFTQYTLTFSKRDGGDSYCDDVNVSSIPGISDACKFRNWENQPLFIGYSYIGHIIKAIDRPKYYTSLEGDIQDVKFYKKKLSAQEVSDIKMNPYCVEKSTKLAVNLDFDDILSVGTHITQWRRPATFKPAYKCDKEIWEFNTLKTVATIPERTTIKAVIEVSDDEQSIKDRFEVTLKDGASDIDISSLIPSQFIRITTDLEAYVGEGQIAISKLIEYEVFCTNENRNAKVLWATRRDFSEGDFNGALGFLPPDRLKIFDEYTDVIHG
ncbi:MAG: hypothetical protein LBN22_09135, partial [Clostridiales Family XIII bacterium]|nr:hypothetical protein [Clostridiales Family XIII bacterium]